MAVSRFSPVYWNGKKIAETQKVSYTENGNVTQEIASEGFLCNSLGPILTDCKIDCILTTAGMTTRLQVQQTGKLGTLIDGRMKVIDATVAQAQYDSDAEKGRSSATFSFTGGAPTEL
jgi:hypothetical protein